MSNTTTIQHALIYCRVSSKKQTIEGSGLQSQEHRCLAYAAQRRYIVDRTFLESVSGGLEIMDRPAMKELLSFLDTQKKKGQHYVVIFDDHKRFARHTEIHLQLRREMEARGAKIEYLNFAIDDTPEGVFIDTMLAAQSQLEREQIGKQTKDKTRARLEKGYWTFRAPLGYKYVPSKTGGKELVIDEPLASVVKEALEGFASGRFATQAELKRFLEASPHFPEDLPNSELRTETVRRLLSKVLYAGYLEAPKWNISRRKAQHEPLITLETYERIQQRRQDNAYLPMRKDIHKDFILRGAVCCASCKRPFTSGWPQGKRKKYAYYFCQHTPCAMYGKTIPRDIVEGEFERILHGVQPSKNTAKLMDLMFRNAWDLQGQKSKKHKQAYKTELATLNKELQQLLDRIIQADSPHVINAHEQRIDTIERKKLLLEEKLFKSTTPQHSFDDMFEHAMHFLQNPYNLWHRFSMHYRYNY